MPRHATRCVHSSRGNSRASDGRAVRAAGEAGGGGGASQPPKRNGQPELDNRCARRTLPALIQRTLNRRSVAERGRIASYVLWHDPYPLRSEGLWKFRRSRLGRTDQVDGHGLAVDASGVVNPEFDIACILLSRPARFIEWIGNAARSHDAVRRAGEGMVLFCPSRSVNAHEAEALGVVAWIGVVDIDIDEYALLICRGAGYLRQLRCRRLGR
jgi:hypothetical protein